MQGTNPLTLSPITPPPTQTIWSSREADTLPKEYSGLPGMFNDALPDGMGLYLMDKAFIRLGIKPRWIFPAVRLAYLGERAWGALSFRPGIDDEHDRE